MFTSAVTEARTAGAAPTVRGALIVGMKKWLDETHGATGLRTLQAHLPEHEREMWDTGIVVHTARYPASCFRNFGEAAVKLWGRGDPNYLRGVGAFVAFNDLGTYMKIMMRLGSPSFVIRRFPRVWSHYFSDGSLHTNELGERHAFVEIRNWQPYGELGVYGAHGWMKAALEYSGAKRTSVRHEAPAAAAHTYEFRWF